MTRDSINKSSEGEVLLEVCVGSLADALAAQAAGANRVELCGALELGGLTPSLGLVEQVCREIDLPVVVMIRPRAGGFSYRESEFHCMLLDAEKVLAAGAAGIVFGALDSSGAIEATQVDQLTSVAAEKETVFHRAFDFIEQKEQALEQLIQLGVTRLLTTGGRSTAMEGAPELRRLKQLANGRIQLLPGGGITAMSAPALVAETGCQQLHLGASIGRADPSITPESAASLCDLRRLSDGVYRGVDQEIVAEVRSSLR